MVPKDKLIEYAEGIHSHMEAIDKDLLKSINGNKAAGTRIRKCAQLIKGLCGNLRTEVQLRKNSDSAKKSKKSSKK